MTRCIACASESSACEYHRSEVILDSRVSAITERSVKFSGFVGICHKIIGTHQPVAAEAAISFTSVQTAIDGYGIERAEYSAALNAESGFVMILAHQQIAVGERAIYRGQAYVV